MPTLVYFIVLLLRTVITVLLVAMFVRAVLSWFIDDEDSRLVRFLNLITEPVIMPVRSLFERLGWFQNLPIDISFYVSYLLLALLQLLLEMVG